MLTADQHIAPKRRSCLCADHIDAQHRAAARRRTRQRPPAVLAPPAASTTASPRSSAACSTTRATSTTTISAPSLTTRPSTSRSSPTACAPSASRASPSTLPIATSPRPKRKFIIADTPGPRAVHAQHGHRRLHGRRCHRAGRRAQRHPRPDPPPRLHRRAARHSHRHRRHQQDGPGRLLSGSLRRVISRDLQALAAATRDSRADRRSRQRTRRRQRRSPQPAHALVRRARACSSCSKPFRWPSSARMPSFRFPVQRVLRPHQDFRGFAGQIAAGTVRPGDEVVALPSGRRTRVRSITTWDGDLASAHAPQSVVLTLEDEIDLSRGDMIASVAAPPHKTRHFEATVVWMHAKPLRPGATYLLKHTTPDRSCAGRRHPLAHRCRASRRTSAQISSHSMTSAKSLSKPAVRCWPISIATTAPPAASSSSIPQTTPPPARE